MFVRSSTDDFRSSTELQTAGLSSLQPTSARLSGKAMATATTVALIFDLLRQDASKCRSLAHDTPEGLVIASCRVGESR